MAEMSAAMLAEIEARAKASEREAADLDPLVRMLGGLRQRASGAWTGTAGRSLSEVLDAHRKGVQAAQRELRSAASQMRAAASAANQT
jgi:uncharacterized protein YukE